MPMPILAWTATVTWPLRSAAAMALAIASCSIGAAGGDGNQAVVQPGKVTPTPWSPPAQPAFRGATGYGAVSQGGRGGKVMAVTTLADAGPGSLRECIEAEGPRVCVFRVSGVIRFTARPPRIVNPFITIAGQTAPGGGITLAHNGGIEGLTPLVVKDTHDVVIRHLRIRNDRIGGERGSEDSITYEKSQRVIFDHLSASWARDEIISGYDFNDAITISNSIFAWGLPSHDKCALLASHPNGVQNVSFSGNLCAHNGDRNPDVNFAPGSCVEVVNNVFYNAQSEFAEVWETWGGTPVTLVGNSFVAGPDTHPNAPGIVRQAPGSSGTARIYAADNRTLGRMQPLAASVAAAMVAAPDCALATPVQPADASMDRILATAGAFPRDSLDSQVVGEVRARGGRIASGPGRIPAIAPGSPYPDADGDGMDDRWETAHGADPARPDPWEDADGDGTANLDAFLDDRHDQVMAGTAA